MKKLECIFTNELDKNVTISLDNPIEPVNPEAVDAAMDEIISQNLFISAGGNIVKKKAARIVERNVEEVAIELDN